MSRSRRRREEPGPSNWEPGHGSRSYYHDDYSWRHYTPSDEIPPRRSFNYWREEAWTPSSYYPGRRSYGRESNDEQWRGDSRPRQASYPRWQRESGPSRDRGDLESRRDRNPPYRNSSRQRYSTYTPAPYIPRPTFRARSPIESIPPILKPALSPSSPPKKSSEPLKPSPGYLSLSQEPSVILQDPGKTRKLLVLDLNGTLLFRSPRSRVASSGPQLRPVQPRPYMQSFRQYLFCADTKAWLDTMVWSSAQPHSVDDMVDKVFGATKNELKVVWNRKSLGLSEAEYHQKTVTTKDLAKPWNLFAPTLGPGRIEGHSVVPSQSQSVHSAFTTLLLDDSPHKAALQPYNHVCLPEYDSMKRQHDLRSLLATKGSKEGKQSKKAGWKNQFGTAVHPIDQMASELPSPGGLPESTEKELYDVTLLAVVGILEAVKLQSNVAGWIRKGGLWATRERREEVGGLDVNAVAVSNTAVRTGNDASSTSGPSMTSEQAQKIWFDDSSVLAYWAAWGRKALMGLGIQVVHGVTG